MWDERRSPGDKRYVPCKNLKRQKDLDGVEEKKDVHYILLSQLLLGGGSDGIILTFGRHASADHDRRQRTSYLYKTRSQYNSNFLLLHGGGSGEGREGRGRIERERTYGKSALTYAANVLDTDCVVLLCSGIFLSRENIPQHTHTHTQTLYTGNTRNTLKALINLTTRDAILFLFIFVTCTRFPYGNCVICIMSRNYIILYLLVSITRSKLRSNKLIVSLSSFCVNVCVV